MKAKKWQRTVSLLLCLLMAMSFLTVTAPKAYAADDTTAAEVTWPQLTEFKLTDDYVYNDSDVSKATVKYKVKGTAIITQYPKLVTKKNNKFAGEVHITVESPVSVADGTSVKPTKNIWIAGGRYSGAASNAGAVQTTNNLKSAQSTTDGNIYTNESATSIVKITYTEGETAKALYYSVHVKIDTGSGNTNTAPTLKAGVASTATATATVGTAWTLDLATIFTDADNDTLTYKVSVNGAAPVDADVNYSYTPTAAGTTTLVFTANDGKVDSPTYTVTLTVLEEGEVAWSQLTNFQLANATYVYNDYDTKYLTTAWKIKRIYIDNYAELKYRTGQDNIPYAGEVQITVEAPVTVENGVATSTPATENLPTDIWLKDDSFSGAVSKDGTIVKNNLHMVQTTPGTYASNTYVTEVKISYDGGKLLFYSLCMTVDTGSGDTNTAPALKAGVASTATATATVGTAWTLDLATIFEDADNDTLTYKVSVNGAEPVDADVNYSYTPTAAGPTTLVFTANDGKADSPTYTVTLTVAETGEVTWPQLTEFKLTDDYVYNDSDVSKATVKYKVKGTAIITQYPKLVTKKNNKFAGEVHITVESPVSVADGTSVKPTKNIWIAGGRYSGAASNAGAVQTTNNLKSAQSTTDGNIYTNESATSIVKITYTEGETAKALYYSVHVKIDTGSGNTNTAPTLKAGVASTATATATVGTAWTLDLATIFTDADNDTLTYKVSVNGAAPVDADVNYSYTPTAAGTTTLVFTANDGKVDSPTYTVTLTATAADEVAYAITATVEGAYIVSAENKTSPMGTTEITVNSTLASEAKAGDHIVVKAIPQKYSFLNTDLYDAKFDHWVVVAGPTGLLSGEKLKAAELTFDMPTEDVSLKAVFVAVGSQVTLTANNFAAGDVSLMIGDWTTVASTYDFASSKHTNDSVTRTVIAGATVSANITTPNVPSASINYKLVRWEITNTTTNEPVTDVAYSDYGSVLGTIQRPSFTVDGTSSYTIKAIFAAKDYGDVNVAVKENESMGTATAQIGTGTADASIDAVVEGTEVKLQAQPNSGYIFQSWSATYGSDNTQVKIANSTAAQTTFVMPATKHEAVNVVATFTEDPNYLSEECDLEEVALLDANGSLVGEYDQVGTVFTITLPADMDTTNLANMILKLTYSKNAQVFKDGSETAWDANGQACNMTLGTVTKFVVRSQKDLAEGSEGPTQEYTITIQKAAVPGTPTLSDGSATRSSKTAATVKFTTNEAGTYYYKVVNHGATAPTVDTSKSGTAAVKGENTITLSNLTEDARDIYIVVKNASGGESAALKVEIPAYGSGSETPDTGKFTISVNAPKGGKITTNRTKADKGDEIIVTVTPDSGYQMVEGSLTYSLAVAGGETVKITGNLFTMPAGNVTITCKWETATTTAKGITSFSISGVVGAVNNTTNTITITLPRGTDVTKLTPVIATNGVKSLTPGSGETVDFTNAVTYTAAMEDGSSKTYTVTVYVDKGTLADQFWDKLTDFATQVPWWQYAEKQQSTSKYPKYW